MQKLFRVFASPTINRVTWGKQRDFRSPQMAHASSKYKAIAPEDVALRMVPAEWPNRIGAGISHSKWSEFWGTLRSFGTNIRSGTITGGGSPHGSEWDAGYKHPFCGECPTFPTLRGVLGTWRGAAQVTALPYEKGLRLQRLGDADHAFFSDEFGEFFFAHAFRAVGAQGDH